MKFSFESQQHRDDIAEELMGAEKSQRKALLEKKKNTLEYVLAQHIKDFERKNNQRQKQEIQDVEDFDTADVEKKSEIKEVSIKETGPLKMEDHKIEIETIDISDQIPESMKIVYDMNRLLEIEYSYRDEEVSSGWYKNDSVENDVHKDDSYINRDKQDSVAEIVRKYISMVENVEGKSLLKHDGTPMRESDIEELIERAKEDFVKFRETATSGLVNNPKVFFHTIGAYTEGFEYDWHRSTMIAEDSVKAKLRNRFPNSSEGFEIEEKPLEIDENLISDGLFVHAGKLIYDNPLKPLMIINGDSPRFEKQIPYYFQKPSGDKEPACFLDLALKAANTNNQWGIKLISNDPAGVHWLLIADQIFDPYHGRLIKIREVV